MEKHKMQIRLLVALVGVLAVAWPQTNAPNGGTQKFTDTLDASGAKVSIPAARGTGVPAAATCDSTGEVGSDYQDDASGGLRYHCYRTGASTFAWVAVGSGGATGSGTAGTLYVTDTTGTSDTYVGVLQTVGVSGSTATPLVAYTEGQSLFFHPNTCNLGAATINIDGKGAKSINMSSGAPLIDNTLCPTGDSYYQLFYTGGSFRVLNSSRVLPEATGFQYGRLTTFDGVSWAPTFKTFCNASGLQALNANATAIVADRECVEVDPNADRVLSAVPTIADGEGGQKLKIQNIDTAFSVTLQDETALPGSNICIGHGGTLAARAIQTYLWSNRLLCWAKDGGSGSSSAAVVKSLGVANFPVNEIVSAGSTRVFPMTSAEGSASGRNTVFPAAGVLSDFVITTATTNTGAGSVVCTLQLNNVAAGSPSPVTITIPASAVAGKFSDLTNTLTIAAQDNVRWACVAPAGGASGTLLGQGWVFKFL
jgi:hypothetical protein